MSAPVRFLGLAVAGWVGVRLYMATSGLPYTAAAMDVPPPPSSPIAALAPEPPQSDSLAAPPGWADAVSQAHAATPAPPPPQVAPVQLVYREFVPAGAARSVTVALPPPRRVYESGADFGAIAPADDYPLSRIAAAAPRPAPARPFESSAGSFVRPVPQPLDRLSLTAWSMMRQSVPGLSTPRGLGSTGMLGGSQAGARLTWAYSRSLAVSARFSAPIDQQKLAGEAAIGIAWKPLRSVPVRIIAERRKALGTGAGRDAFAVFAEGGVYQRPLPFGLKLDGYAQAGVVGARSRDLFAEGGATATRPLGGKLKRFSIGAGVWGGLQPGVSRLDVGPRLSMQWGRSTRIHLDYRLKVLGNAQPGSGPAVTVAGDF